MAKLDADNDEGKKYKVEAIWDNAVSTKKSKSGYLLGLYYLALWKNYLEEKNIWEPYSAI